MELMDPGKCWSLPSPSCLAVTPSQKCWLIWPLISGLNYELLLKCSAAWVWSLGVRGHDTDSRHHVTLDQSEASIQVM